MFGLTLILVLAIMGGAIAFIGDKLGSKIGKKRLSIFGLRPYHTSVLMTVITGIMIAAATLGVLAVTSKDVKTALFGMEKLKTELIALKTPAILIPLPHGQQNEQLQNARFFENLGLGHVLLQEDITPHLLLATIHAMIKEKSEFEKKFQEAQVYIHHDAVKKIAQEVLYYGERRSSKSSTPTSS